MTDRRQARDRRHALTAAAAVVGTLAVLVLAVWAATIGPGRVLEGDGPGRVTLTSTPTPTPTEEPSSAPSSDPEDAAPARTPLAVKVVGVLLVAVACAGLAGVAFLLLRQAVRRRRPARSPRAAVAFDPLRDPDPDPGAGPGTQDALARAVAAGAEDQRAALLGSTPRAGIVACWSRFEQHAEEAGVRREPWETSTELTGRVLASVGADADAVERLARLFRAARFGEREPTEVERSEAVALLDRIHRSLGHRAGARP